MPDDGNGRVTLAVVGEKVDNLTAVVEHLRTELHDMREIPTHIAVLEGRVDTNARDIEANRAMRRESRIWDGLLSAAALYAAIQGFGP